MTIIKEVQIRNNCGLDKDCFYKKRNNIFDAKVHFNGEKNSYSILLKGSLTSDLMHEKNCKDNSNKPTEIDDNIKNTDNTKNPNNKLVENSNVEEYAEEEIPALTQEEINEAQEIYSRFLYKYTKKQLDNSIKNSKLYTNY